MKTERRQRVEDAEPQRAMQLRGSHQTNGEPQHEDCPYRTPALGRNGLPPVPLPCFVIEERVAAVDPEGAAAASRLPTAGLAVGRS